MSAADKHICDSSQEIKPTPASNWKPVSAAAAALVEAARKRCEK